jgi:hypothetical protein
VYSSVRKEDYRFYTIGSTVTAELIMIYDRQRIGKSKLIEQKKIMWCMTRLLAHRAVDAAGLGVEIGRRLGGGE